MEFYPMNDITMPMPLQQKSAVLKNPDKIRKKRKPPKTPWKKPKDMPKRPLSAYNLFFAHEREKLLRERGEAKANSLIKPDTVSSSKAEKKDSNQVRPHQKSSGIGFANLAKTIAASWNTVDPTLRAEFQAKAKIEKDRYNEQMLVWREKKRLEAEASGNKSETQDMALETLTKPTPAPSQQMSTLPTPSPSIYELQRRSMSMTLARIQDSISQMAMSRRMSESALCQSREALRIQTEALRQQLGQPQQVPQQQQQFEQPQPSPVQSTPNFDPFEDDDDWTRSMDSVLPSESLLQSFNEDTLHLSGPSMNRQNNFDSLNLDGFSGEQGTYQSKEASHEEASVFQASLKELGTSLDDDTVNFLTNLKFDGLSSV